MTEVIVSKRSGLDAGGAADRKSDESMDMAIEMAMAATSSAAETAGEDTLEPIERNENGMRRRRCEVLLGCFHLSDYT